MLIFFFKHVQLLQSSDLTLQRLKSNWFLLLLLLLLLLGSLLLSLSSSSSLQGAQTWTAEVCVKIMKFLLFAISCASLYIHLLKKVIWNLNCNELCWLYLLFVVFAKKDFEVLNHRSWRCKEKLKHQRNEGNHDNNSVSNDFNTVDLVI